MPAALSFGRGCCFYLAVIFSFGILFTGCAHTVKGAVAVSADPVPEARPEQRDNVDGNLHDKAPEEDTTVQSDGQVAANEDEYDLDDDEYNENESEKITIADPLEPWNRGMFVFNDRLYFWVIKPVTKVYSYLIPEDIRVIFKNFYRNITTPIRLVNSLLQLKMKSAGIELLRFLINTTAGVFGFVDVAREDFDLQVQDEDFGQTLGRYGIGQGIYIVWPFIGPSTLRETVGLAGDLMLNPLGGYVVATELSFETAAAFTVHDYTNDLSFRIGEYEALKAAAIDPYIMLRNAYIQNRKAKVEK